MSELATIENLLKELKSELKKTDEKVTDIQKDNKRFLGEWKQHKEEVSNLKRQVNTLNAASSSMEKQLEMYARKEREKNIIIYHLNDSDEVNNNLVNSVLQVLKKAGIDLSGNDIDTARRVGKVVGRRPVLVELTTRRSKNRIFERISNCRAQNIIIANDLTKKQRTEREMLKKHQNTLKELGEESFLRDNKLKHSNRLYNVYTIDDLVKKIKKEKTRKDANSEEAYTDAREGDSDSDGSVVSTDSVASRKRVRISENRQASKRGRHGAQSGDMRKFLITDGKSMVETAAEMTADRSTEQPA